MPHFLSHALKAPGSWGLRIARTGALLVKSLEMAGDSEARRKGLLGRTELPRDTGLVIAPCQGIHTFGMQFPIDIIGISRDGSVVKWRSAVAPRRLVFALRAFAILETAAGVAEQMDLRVGDRLIPVQVER